MGIGAITGSLSPNLIKYMGLTERMGGVATGIYMAIATVTALPINILAGFLIERIGRYRVLFLGALFLALSMATLATSLAESARYVSSIFNGIALAMILVSSSEIAVNVPSPARGTSSAIYSSMLLIGVAIGSPLSGYLTEKVTISIRDLTLYSPYLVPAIMALILSASLAIYRPRSLEEKS
jgi:MFS family permease